MHYIGHFFLLFMFLNIEKFKYKNNKTWISSCIISRLKMFICIFLDVKLKNLFKMFFRSKIISPATSAPDCF